MTQETATSERNRDTGPLSMPPTPPGNDAAPTTTNPQPWRPLLLIALALLVLGGAAFVLTRINDPMNDPRPVETVQSFAAALEARDPSRMLSHIEPTVFRREFGPELRMYVEYIERIEFRDERYELLENDGRQALVRLTATVDYAVREQGSATQDIDQTFELVNLEGTWYLRGITLPT